MSEDTTARASTTRARAPARAQARAPQRAGAADEHVPHIEFRALTRTDLELLHAWLRDAEVARWYSSGAPTRAAVRRKYTPRIAGRSPTRVFIARVDGRDAGLAQAYAIAEYPEHARALGAGADWFGLDYFIGEPELRGRRLAHRIVGAFLEAVLAPAADAAVCASLPAHDNLKSIRTLERAGFRALRRVELTRGQTDVLMICSLARYTRPGAHG